MKIEALESEISALTLDELALIGAWVDRLRDEKIGRAELTAKVEEVHREEVLNRKERYLAHPSEAKPMDAAYFEELRRALEDA